MRGDIFKRIFSGERVKTEGFSIKTKNPNRLAGQVLS